MLSLDYAQDNYSANYIFMTTLSKATFMHESCAFPAVTWTTELLNNLSNHNYNIFYTQRLS